MAPTVVLLHAFPFDKSLWDDVVDAVAEAGWDVVVPDLRGFGESFLSEDETDDEPSLRLMARDVLDILDRLGVSAMEIARQDPSRLAGLVLVDTKATADSEQAREGRLRVAEQVLESESTEALARAMVPTLLGVTTQSERPELVADVKARVESADPEAVAWAQRAMAARPDSRADLAALSVPSLVVWGEEDVMSPRDEQDLMVESLRDVRFVPIPASGHLSVVEAPGAVTAALLAFLHDVRRLPASD